MSQLIPVPAQAQALSVAFEFTAIRARWEVRLVSAAGSHPLGAFSAGDPALRLPVLALAAGVTQLRWRIRLFGAGAPLDYRVLVRLTSDDGSLDVEVGRHEGQLKARSVASATGRVDLERP